MSDSNVNRPFLAVMLYLRGHSLAAIAERMPRHLPGNGISEKSAEIMLRSGQRVLLSGILRDRKPDGLPDEAWPPPEVREAIRESCGSSWRGGLKALRAWLDDQQAANVLLAAGENTASGPGTPNA
ncbi:MAG TPA: hypothetical protein VNT60_02600 [Deinococcales bacterium]|nr:hypothetical protein [Deinococcales bacterium]